MSEMNMQVQRMVLASLPRPATLPDRTPKLSADGRPLVRMRVAVVFTDEDFRPTTGSLVAPEVTGKPELLGPVIADGLRANLYEMDGKPGWSLKADRITFGADGAKP